MNSLKENHIRLNVLGVFLFFFFTDFQEKRHAIKSGTAREYVMKLHGIFPFKLQKTGISRRDQNRTRNWLMDK